MFYFSFLYIFGYLKHFVAAKLTVDAFILSILFIVIELGSSVLPNSLSASAIAL